MAWKIIEVDARGRISLGELGKHNRYLAEVDEDGTIRLHPAVVLTQVEYDNLINKGEKG